MRGPIDFVIVGFEGNKFNGGIIEAISDAVDKGIISLVDLLLITKDKDGAVTKVNIADIGEEYQLDFIQEMPSGGTSVSQDDIDEVSELLENNTSAGMLVIEHLWAKPLKQAIIDANGVLVADGRIHPDAAFELGKGA